MEISANTPRLILLDRDGTVIVEKDYLDNPDGVELIAGVADAIARLKQHGHKVVLITNQSGVARGYFDENTVQAIHARLQEKIEQESGIRLDAIYYCPHGPEDHCECRKPNTGMLLQASREMNFPLDQAVVIGDKPADIEAGQRVGAMTILVRTGYGEDTEAEYPQQATIVADDLPSAVSAILDAN